MGEENADQFLALLNDDCLVEIDFFRHVNELQGEEVFIYAEDSTEAMRLNSQLAEQTATYVFEQHILPMINKAIAGPDVMQILRKAMEDKNRLHQRGVSASGLNRAQRRRLAKKRRGNGNRSIANQPIPLTKQEADAVLNRHVTPPKLADFVQSILDRFEAIYRKVELPHNVSYWRQFLLTNFQLNFDIQLGFKIVEELERDKHKERKKDFYRYLGRAKSPSFEQSLIAMAYNIRELFKHFVREFPPMAISDASEMERLEAENARLVRQLLEEVKTKKNIATVLPLQGIGASAKFGALAPDSFHPTAVRKTRIFMAANVDWISASGKNYRFAFDRIKEKVNFGSLNFNQMLPRAEAASLENNLLKIWVM